MTEAVVVSVTDEDLDAIQDGGAPIITTEAGLAIVLVHADAEAEALEALAEGDPEQLNIIPVADRR